MSCRRIRRELLWLVRFGDFDAGSAPHLDHLAGCQGCRDDVGLDRALVRQLRTALAARVGDASPSPSAWEGVLARMRQPEPSFVRPWPARLAAFLRAGSAMAGASLALVVALNLEMAPMGPVPTPEASGLGFGSASTPAGRGSGLRHWDGRAPAAGTGFVREEPTFTIWVPTPAEQLPLDRSTLVAQSLAKADAASAPDPSEDINDQGPAVVLRLVPLDAAAMSASSQGAADDEPDDEPATPAVQPVGGPS
jgi:hypothetical protein